MRGGTTPNKFVFTASGFQSTRPVRGGTLTLAKLMQDTAISIHPPRAGRDSKALRLCSCQRHFNPPAPCGAGRLCGRKSLAHSDFNPPAPCGAGRRRMPYTPSAHHFNPPAPCGAGHQRKSKNQSNFTISIHPPRAGRDSTPFSLKLASFNFNPPAPCGAGP